MSPPGPRLEKPLVLGSDIVHCSLVLVSYENQVAAARSAGEWGRVIPNV